MLLSEPQSTSFDVEFRAAGIPVRVSGLFWLGSVLIGWNACLSFARGDQRELLLYLAIWTAVVLVSILVHELGHALAYRWYGQSSRIVLYHFGGMAIPGGWQRRHLRPAQRFVVSAAGPVAQLFLAAVVILGLRAAGFVVPFPFESVAEALGFDDGRRFGSLRSLALAEFLVSVNVLWPLLNLVPVPPLDGGQMTREALAACGVGDAARIASGIGMVAGGLLGWWAAVRDDRWLAIMFAMLAVACYQDFVRQPPWKRWN